MAIRRRPSLAAAALLGALAPTLVGAARAADPRAHLTPDRFARGRFVATCENSGRFCEARACGGDQIAAAERCEALCPGAVVTNLAPATCPVGIDRVDRLHVPLPDVLPDLAAE